MLIAAGAFPRGRYHFTSLSSVGLKGRVRMVVSACRTGDRTSHRVTALENELETLKQQLGRWQEFTPPLEATGMAPFSASLDHMTTQADPRARKTINLGAGGTRRGWFIRIGNRMHVRYAFTWGSPPWDGETGAVVSELPPGVSTDPGGIHYFHGHLWTTSGTEGNMDLAGSGYLPDEELWLFVGLAFPVAVGWMIISGRNSSCAAGAEWLQKSSDRTWVRTYDLKKAVASGGANSEITLEDAEGRSLTINESGLYENPNLWDLVENGIRHSVVLGGATTNRLLRLKLGLPVK